MNPFYIKTNRIFTPVRKYSWLFVFLVAFGGLWFPKLGLLMIPLMLALAVMGFIRGKYWCGNLCPHGSLFDSLIMRFSPNRKIPRALKTRVAAALMFTWFMYMLVSRLIKVFDIWGTTPFIDKLGYIFVVNYLMVTVLGTVLAFAVSPRAWCSFCPMSTMQILMYKLAKLLRANAKTDVKVTTAGMEMCHSCGKCSRVCPMQLTPYLEFNGRNQFDNEACIKCSTCVNNCPAAILSLSNVDEAARIKEETDNDGYADRKKITASIKQIKKLSEDVNEYTFKFVAPEKMDYKPGQFVLVKIQDSPIMYRAYSISSCNKDGSELSVTVKRVPGGYGTDIIFNTFREGNLVELDGPMGGELALDKNTEKVLFIAGGIGITPFVPMTRYMLKKADRVKDVKLIYGVNYEKELIYDEHFSTLAAESSKFEYIKTVSADNNWKGRRGFVTDAMKDMDLSGYKIYMCGPPPMIKASLKALQDAGVAEENIYYESA
jgi:NAD(P)H-flavin reductase/ferredoxin